MTDQEALVFAIVFALTATRGPDESGEIDAPDAHATRAVEAFRVSAASASTQLGTPQAGTVTP